MSAPDPNDPGEEKKEDLNPQEAAVGAVVDLTDDAPPGPKPDELSGLSAALAQGDDAPVYKPHSYAEIVHNSKNNLGVYSRWSVNCMSAEGVPLADRTWLGLDASAFLDPAEEENVKDLQLLRP